MREIPVAASRPYRVFLGGGQLPTLGERLSAIHESCTVVIVSGPRVWPLYGETMEKTLTDSGFRVLHFLHPDGEDAKSLAVYGELQNFLCENRLSRSDLLLALGGGVTGDLCGFAAATYQRGVDYVQVPTTLLAMVDSSVGGKTALNLPGGKNQLGAFYQPLAVFADTDSLATLPPVQLRSGLGEVVKYALMGDEALFSALERGQDPCEETVIERCIVMKRDIVERDEHDTGERQLLNLGHSFGHAVEACSGFTLPHGIAVGVGLAIIGRYAHQQGLFADGDLTRLLSLLNRLNLPTDCEYGKAALLHALVADKKRRGDAITLILPRSIGHCERRSVALTALDEQLTI